MPTFTHVFDPCLDSVAVGVKHNEHFVVVTFRGMKSGVEITMVMTRKQFFKIMDVLNEYLEEIKNEDRK